MPLGTQDEEEWTPCLSSWSPQANETDTFAKGVQFRVVTSDDKGGQSGTRRPGTGKSRVHVTSMS